MTAANKSRYDQNFNELQNASASSSYTSKTIASSLSSMIEKVAKQLTPTEHESPNEVMPHNVNHTLIIPESMPAKILVLSFTFAEKKRKERVLENSALLSKADFKWCHIYVPAQEVSEPQRTPLRLFMWIELDPRQHFTSCELDQNCVQIQVLSREASSYNTFKDRIETRKRYN